jgi:hypothetical protein
VAIPESFDVPAVTSDHVPSENDSGSMLRIAADLSSSSSLHAVVSELMIEVTRSIEAYRVAEPGVQIDHAVIGGSCAIEGALTEAIQRKYDIIAQPYNPASCFGWDEDKGAGAGAFASTIGLVLGQVQEQDFKFDFLHPKRQVTRREQRMKRAPIAIVTGVIAVAAVVTFYIRCVKPQYDRRDDLRTELAELEDDLDRQKEFKQTVRLLDEYEDQRVVWIDQLHDMLTVPVLADSKNIVLGGIDMSQKRHRISMPYRAKDETVGNLAVSELEALKTEEKERQRFDAVLGATSGPDTKEKYKYNGTLQIAIVDRDWASDKKRSSRKRR